MSFGLLICSLDVLRRKAMIPQLYIRFLTHFPFLNYVLSSTMWILATRYGVHLGHREVKEQGSFVSGTFQMLHGLFVFMVLALLHEEYMWLFMSLAGGLATGFGASASYFHLEELAGYGNLDWCCQCMLGFPRAREAHSLRLNREELLNSEEGVAGSRETRDTVLNAGAPESLEEDEDTLWDTVRSS